MVRIGDRFFCNPYITQAIFSFFIWKQLRVEEGERQGCALDAFMVVTVWTVYGIGGCVYTRAHTSVVWPMTRDEIHLEHVLPLFASWRGDVVTERIIFPWKTDRHRYSCKSARTLCNDIFPSAERSRSGWWRQIVRLHVKHRPTPTPFTKHFFVSLEVLTAASSVCTIFSTRFSS